MSPNIEAINLDHLFVPTLYTLFILSVCASFFWGARKYGGIKSFLFNYFRWSLTFMKFWLVFLVIWLILALAFVSYAYLSADEQGKAKIKEIIQQVTNPQKTIEQNMREGKQQPLFVYAVRLQFAPYKQVQQAWDA